MVFDAMVTKHEPGNNGQLAQFIFSPDSGTHQMGYCFSRKHVAFEVSFAAWPTYSPSLVTGYKVFASTQYDLQKGTWARYAVQMRGCTFSVWMNGEKMVEYEFTDDDLLDEGREEVRMHFILFYPTNLTMYLDNIVAAAPDFDVATETGTIYNVLTFDGDAENVPAATKIGKEPEEGEEDTRPVYSIYEEAEAAQGKDRPRTVYVDKDNNPFVYENILNNETGEYESQLVPFDKSIKILPTTHVKTFAEENGWFFAGGTGAYTIVKLEQEILLGDGNNDGKVDMKDIITAIRASLKYKIDTLANFDALDVNRDRKIDTKDIILLVRYANNYTQNIPIGQPISSLTA